MDRQRLRTFVLGGLVGALASVLLTPRSGKELRGSIANRAGEARERGRESYFEAQERMRERIAEVRGRSSRVGEEIHSVREDADPLPRLGTERSEPEPSPLRDVSRNIPRPESGGDPEEIRRKIQETRSRLRAQLRASPGNQGAGDANSEDRQDE